WVCALHFFWRASNTNRNWPYLAIALILGALGKQMMLVFPLLMLLYAAWNQHDLLRNYRFWLAWMTPFLGLLPTLLWNLNNSWITLLHTEHHFQARGGGMLSVAELLAGQLGSLGPVLGGLVLVYLARSFTRSRHLDRAQRFLFCFCGPALLVFLVLSLRQRINANWPAAFYLPAILLVVVLAHQKTQTNTSRQLRLAALTGLLFCLLVGSLPYWSPRLKEKDPTLRLRGWSELANRVQPLRQSQELLIGDERRTVSALAFYLPDNPPFFRYPGPEANIVSQYELWPPPPPGSNALLVLDHLPDPQLANGFAEWHPLGTISVPTGSTERIYYLFRGLDLIHWPRIQIGESR
ncbi:MAG: hypothetical protein KDC71_04950, partial [Acidobacteria bacterium]|nr:hypothetical protein [Acidobacteriota bacterium]